MGLKLSSSPTFSATLVVGVGAPHCLLTARWAILARLWKAALSALSTVCSDAPSMLQAAAMAFTTVWRWPNQPAVLALRGMLISPKTPSLQQIRSRNPSAWKLAMNPQNQWGLSLPDSQCISFTSDIHLISINYLHHPSFAILIEHRLYHLLVYSSRFIKIELGGEHWCITHVIVITYNNSNCKSMADRFNQLPEFIRNLIPEPNFSEANLHELTSENAKTITNSIKTKTALDLLKPIQIHEPDLIITFKPIILVFCQPSQELVIDRDKIYPYTPIAYASWLEAAGARCVPLPYNINEGSIQFLLERSHGLLIPGGGSNLYKNFDQKEGQGPVMIGFLKIWRFIQKLWAKGVYYPIWGTCLGLQIMLLALSGDVKILSRLNSRGHQVQIYSHYDNSWMLRKMPIKLRMKAQNCKLLNFQHTYGISVKKFLNEPKLAEKLKIVQISKDKDGKWFCSGMEGKNNPIFITQYHPQKQAYQWTRTGEIRHNQDSIQLSQHLAMSFLSHCRRCKPPKEFGSLSEQIFHTIQNYKQIHTPEKMYKVYAIDFKFREYDKETRKQIKSKRSISIASKGNLKF